MKNLSTFTNGETTFSVSILETGWIYDVFLILTNEIRSNYKDGEFKKIRANHIARSKDTENTFSVFEASYQFEQPTDCMAYFFLYSIEGVTYVTAPTCFTVENY